MSAPGTVASLWRFPVKSMQGEPVPKLVVTRHGAVGDRAWGIFDLEKGGIASAKDTRAFPALMQCRARFLAAPQVGAAAPHVQINLPDGGAVCSDAPEASRVLSDFFDRDVLLVRAEPGMLTYKQYRRKHGKAAQERAAAPSDDGDSGRPAGALRDAYAVSVITTSTLAALQTLQPTSDFDLRRFRMNVVVDTQADGFIENDWPKRTLALGADCRLRATVPDPRCIMTTLPQDDLAHDAAVLKAIAQHNRLRVTGLGQRPCAGVYAEVLQPGTVSVGDALMLA